MKVQESLRLSIRVLKESQDKFKYLESESSFNIDTFRSMTGEGDILELKNGEVIARKRSKRDRKIEKHK